MAKKENKNNISNTVSIGNVQGPVVASGDMHIDQINYNSNDENNVALQEKILQRIDDVTENVTEAMEMIIGQLNNQQLEEINQTYRVLEEKQLLEKDTAPILSELQTVIKILDDKAVPLSVVENIKTTASIINAEEISVNQKLKLSIPLIPLILNYEGEIGLDSTINLKRAWNWLKGKFQTR